MGKEFAIKLLEKMMVMKTLFFLLFYFCLHVSLDVSFIWSLVFAVMLEAVLPYLHVLCQKVAYRLLRWDASISIEMGKRTWYVTDASEYVYTKVEMMVILLSPLVVLIFPSVYLFWQHDILSTTLCSLIIMVTVLGMLENIHNAIKVLADNADTYYKMKDGKMVKYAIKKRQAL
ncbi:metalloprotease family protein (plasmid) [Aneurinibacillus sp. Ricciae_BoGa-3]|uniref:metalloprotease family protein n=1 Tax=Aneurinibacillus sp. Ricciae_BoGa-3 TaxID=3022697 RepID=UPI002340A8D1|nr:metalloprotease family protein [Aneurinibacillus sp. Ricciae_BoGa-3]WCK57570.1 metalloprotease family protein [Aneurinibacillus sp. Ricciae_BoGa-3]